MRPGKARVLTSSEGQGVGWVEAEAVADEQRPGEEQRKEQVGHENVVEAWVYNALKWQWRWQNLAVESSKPIGKRLCTWFTLRKSAAPAP